MDSKLILELAHKQLDRVLGFFSRVETKASFIFAVNSAMLGTLAVHVERVDLVRLPTLIALVLAGAGLCASYYFVYSSSFPNLIGGHSSLIYFKEIAKLREQEFIKAFREQTEDSYIDDVLSQAWRNSEILSKKFRAIKIAFFATGVSLLPWAAFLILASLVRATVPII
jgi:hypothetical protein